MMERYSEYKDSGVKWLGEIPSHWEVVRGLGVFSENKSKNTQLENSTVLSLSYGKIIVKKDIDSGLVPEEYSSYQIVRPGCIIVRSTDLQNDKTSLRIGYVCDEGIITSAYLGLQVKGNNNDKYLYYFLHDWDITKEIYRHGNGLRQSLSWNDLRDNSVLLPPLSEQDAIVRYLDTATSEIDKAIAMQQKMIDLLNERKQIIIQNAVTKGLDENVEMKESGVEWIGRIPKHWEVSKLKYIIKEPLKYGANEVSEYIDYSCPRYIRITDIDSNGKLKEDTFRSLPRDKAKPYLLSKGDILFARSGATVGKAFLFEEEYKACYAGYLIKASLDNKKVLSKFVYLYTQTLAYQRWKESIFIQATIQNISGEKYSNMQIAIPPISEQKRLIDWLLPRLNGFDTAIVNCHRQITLLQERKQIIINEVVTGKVRVS